MNAKETLIICRVRHELPGSETREIRKENRYVVDNRCSVDRAVAVGTDEQLHDGWVNSHFVGYRYRRRSAQVYSRSQNCLAYGRAAEDFRHRGT